MHRFNYKTKYHYALKYLVLALPILTILLLYLVKDIDMYHDLLNNFGDFMIAFQNAPINEWYIDIITLIGLDSFFIENTVTSIITLYPLYIFWVYVIDIVLDIFTLIPKLAHKFFNKLGGEKYE